MNAFGYINPVVNLAGCASQMFNNMNNTPPMNQGPAYMHGPAQSVRPDYAHGYRTQYPRYTQNKGCEYPRAPESAYFGSDTAESKKCYTPSTISAPPASEYASTNADLEGGGTTAYAGSEVAPEEAPKPPIIQRVIKYLVLLGFLAIIIQVPFGIIRVVHPNMVGTKYNYGWLTCTHNGRGEWLLDAVVMFCSVLIPMGYVLLQNRRQRPLNNYHVLGAFLLAILMGQVVGLTLHTVLEQHCGKIVNTTYSKVT